MVANHDHRISRIELRTFAVRGHESALLALQALGATDRHALARDQLGQGLHLALDSPGPLGVDVDQTPAGVLATEVVGGGQQPALRVLVEDDEILGRRDADDGLAQPAPFVMRAEGGHQTRA